MSNLSPSPDFMQVSFIRLALFALQALFCHKMMDKVLIQAK